MLANYLQLGGPLMWPLLTCSVLLGAVLFERTWTLLIRRRALGLHVSAQRLTWHRRVLPFFTDVPPSVGLLGTVVGVADSFSVLGGRLDTQAIGAGLSVAILTTIFGLSIAIIAAVASYLFDWAGGVRDHRLESAPA